MTAPAIISYPALPTAYTPMKPGARRIDMIVLHATGGSQAGDLFTLSGRDRRRLVSIHYYVTKAPAIYQLVQDNDTAWHAGVSFWQGEEDCNRFSIGIELENLNDGTDPYPQAQIDAARWLVRSKVEQYRIPPSRLVRHAQIALPAGRKTDPLGFPWEAFTADVFAPPALPLPTLRRFVPMAEVWVREGPSTQSPWARWQDGPWQGQIVKLSPPNAVDVIGVVTGQMYRKAGYGTSDQWLALAAGGFAWLPQFREVEA